MRLFLPRLLCLVGILAAGSAALLVTATPGAPTRDSMSTLDAGILVQLNAIRDAHALVPLTLSAELTSAATSHATEMVAAGYFGHESPHGASFAKQIERYYPSTGYKHWQTGENLMWSSVGIAARDVVTAWMASAPHRANILAPHWRQIGIAAIHAKAAPGAFGGRGLTVITADFGVRS